MQVLLILAVVCCFAAAATAPSTITLSGVIRDQAPAAMCAKTNSVCATYGGGSCGMANGGLGFNNTDFELPLGTYTDNEKGLVGALCTPTNVAVCGTLGADNTPVYAYPGKSPGGSISSPASFYTWFHDSPVTVNVPINITLTRNPTTNLYSYSNVSFFPIDGRGWGDTCPSSRTVRHNYGFCFEVHLRFQYVGGEVFDFTGDDDVWVYINRKLVIDLGGLHAMLSARVNLDSIPGLVLGSIYPFDFFYCERHTSESNLRITTSLAMFCDYYDWCGVCEGNGQSCCSEQLCSDNNACTIDTCPIQGSPKNQSDCIHTPVQCPVAADACHEVGCDPSSGCFSRPINCDDSNACTIDSCHAVQGCVHTPVTCNDNSQCTSDTCHPTLGCQFPSIVCNDSNLCTTDSCNPASGCQFSAITCNDQNACTSDSCNSARGCVFSTIRCNDQNACTSDSCNSTSGCLFTPVVCDDSNLCTLDSCNVSTGCAFAPISCDDGNACTADSCSASSGCVHTPISCNDNNECTIDSCGASSGCANTPRSCNDTNACTIDSCDPSSGCTYAALSCNDNNACTIDSCSASSGCVYSARSCDDNDACTLDLCHRATGCTHEIIACNDNNACTIDSCSASSGCSFAALSCNDNNACTIDSCNVSSGCSFAAISCNDNNACTVDSCNASSGCSHAALSCNDNNACTVDACDTNTGCAHSNVTCTPSGVATCSTSTCNPTTGCQFSPVIDAQWEHVLLNSWVGEDGLQTQWLATLHTGVIPLFSVTFGISSAIFGSWNIVLNDEGLYELPVWQYRDGVIPAHSSYVSFGYTINGPAPASVSLSSGICAPAHTGCSIEVDNLLVHSWGDAAGTSTGQYNLLVTNVGERVIAHVNVTISPPAGTIYAAWNMISDTPGEYKCQLWNLYPGQSSQACGYNVNYATSVPEFDVTGVEPLCI